MQYTILYQYLHGKDKSMKPPGQESYTVHTWIAEHLLSADAADLPFSFRYSGQSSAALLDVCARRNETRALDANRTGHTVVFGDFATGFELRCVETACHAFPVARLGTPVYGGGLR